jgi:uncharacterized membrane protein YsdA (DUF1294 family)
MDKVMEVLYIIGQALLFILQEAWKWLKIFGEWLFKWLSDWLSTINFPTVMKLFSDVRANRTLFIALAAYIVFMNVWAFSLFARDKHSAKRKQRRISESKLMKVCFFGGAAGGLIGMNVFRHKTLHKKFTVGVMLMFIVQLILYSFILGFLGFWAFF